MKSIALRNRPDEITLIVKKFLNTPYFKIVDPNLIQEILLSAKVYSLEPGDILLSENEPCDRVVYIMLEGGFEVFSQGNFIMSINQPGMTIGEMAVVTPKAPRSADVKAVKQSSVVAIESSFLSKKDEHSVKLSNAFLFMFSNILAEKLRITTDMAKLYENAVLEKKEIDRFNKEITDQSLELKRELQEKLEQIKLFSKVVECSQDGIVTSDSKGDLKSGNQAFFTLFGYEKKEIKNLNIKDIIIGLIVNDSEWKQLYLQGWKGEKKAIRNNGLEFPVLVSISPVGSTIENGKAIPVFAAVIRDISIQKEYEDAILETNKELKSAYDDLGSTMNELEISNRVKEQFLFSITSQLKTPLVSINNYADLINDQIQDHKNRDIDHILSRAERISSEAKKLETLVGNLLALADFSHESTQLIYRLTRITKFSQKIKKRFSSMKNLSLTWDDETLVLAIDEEKMLQAIGDIIVYTIQNWGVDCTIHFHFHHNLTRKYIDIQVLLGDVSHITNKHKKDVPISLDDNIELSFQKAELMLPLAKRAIELHHGEIRIQSTLDAEVIKIRIPDSPDEKTVTDIKIMIIDGNSEDRKTLKEIIKSEFFYCDIFEFETMVPAINAINSIRPNLILIDPFNIDLPWNYQKTLHKIINENDERYTTIVVSNKLKDRSIRNGILKFGVADFLEKPIDETCAFFRITEILKTAQKLDLLSHKVEVVEKIAITDGLTRLFNRKYFDDYLKSQLIKAELKGKKCSLIMTDVDHFKHYNDTNGHQLGDVALATIASIIKNGIRESDMAARYGGEEFVIVLPGVSKSAAMKVAEKLRSSIALKVFKNEEKQPKGMLTASFGVSTYPENGVKAEILLKGADTCLYLAKERGRDTVVAAEGIVEVDEELLS